MTMAITQSIGEYDLQYYHCTILVDFVFLNIRRSDPMFGIHSRSSLYTYQESHQISNEKQQHSFVKIPSSTFIHGMKETNKNKAFYTEFKLK